MLIGGFAEKRDKNAVLAIEWADRVQNLIRKFRQDAVVIWVKIAYGAAENERIIRWGVL